jgi:hypothetical protein
MNDGVETTVGDAMPATRLCSLGQRSLQQRWLWSQVVQIRHDVSGIDYDRIVVHQYRNLAARVDGSQDGQLIHG